MFQLTRFSHSTVFFRNQNARYAGTRCIAFFACFCPYVGQHTGQSVLDFRHHCKESSEITWSTQTLPSIAKFVVWINFAFSQIEKACPHRKTTKIIYEHLSYLCKSKFYISKEYYIMFAFIWNHFHIEKTVFLFMSLRFRIIVMWRILLFFLQLWR